MIERVRTKLQTDELRRRPIRRRMSPKPFNEVRRLPNYAILPLNVMRYPPVRHRGEVDDGKLEPFEVRLLCAALVAAHAEVPAHRFAEAKKVGKAAMASSRNRKFANGAKVRRAGRRAFKAAFAATVPDSVAFETTRAALVKTAGMSPRGAALARVIPALNRLTRGIRAGGETLRPPVLRWRPLPFGKLRVEVSGAWLHFPLFSKVPLPLPSARGGANALALYLFLFSIDPVGGSDASISLAGLCDRLGIKTDERAWAQRAVDRALDLVNQHLENLPAKDYKIDVPRAFKLVTRGGRIRFVRLHVAVAPGKKKAAEPTEPRVLTRQERIEMELEWRESGATLDSVLTRLRSGAA